MISGPNLSHSEIPKSLAVLLEVLRREVIEFVLLQEGANLHARFETKKSAELRAALMLDPPPRTLAIAKACAGRSDKGLAVPESSSFGRLRNWPATEWRLSLLGRQIRRPPAAREHRGSRLDGALRRNRTSPTRRR